MASLWNKKNNNGNALPRASRYVHSKGAPSIETSVTRGIGGNGTALTLTPSSYNDSRIPKRDVAPQLEQPRKSPNGAPPSASPGLSMWSRDRLNIRYLNTNPFPRHGAAINSIASKEGVIYIMGGVTGSTVRGDLRKIESSESGLTSSQVMAISRGPGPRSGHASLLVGETFIVFGGATPTHENMSDDRLDNTLYILNTRGPSHLPCPYWSLAIPDIRPAGRYGHSLNILGSKLYVFGGQTEYGFVNDLVAYDLSQLENPAHNWEQLVRVGQITPPARANHTVVSFNGRLYLFGGTDGQQCFNDIWVYDSRHNVWAELSCVGLSPTPRERHAATLVNDVMFIFGGEAYNEVDLGDLFALSITKRCWYSINTIGTPSPRFGHSMTAIGTKIMVMAGASRKPPSDDPDLSMVYTLDTSNIQLKQKSYIASPETVIHDEMSRKKLPTTQQSLPQKQPVQKMESAVGQMHSPLALRIRSAVDLVRDSYRETEITPSFTKHVIWVSNRSSRQRRVRSEELWKREHELGHGSYGRVWLESCTEGKDPGSQRAVKEIRKTSKPTKIEYERELEALAKFSNKKYVHCFVEFFGWWESPHAIFISMEYVPDGDLQKLLTAPFPESITWEIVGQILEGLEFMHQNDFTHRDLKPVNILVVQHSPTWWVKIADFGISKRALESTALRSIVGTHGYIAPEVLGYVEPSDAQDPSYTSAVDIWALGEITFRLITHQNTFPTPMALARYAAARIPFPYVELDRVGASKEIKDFLKKAMAAHPSQRLSTQDATRHPWIARSPPQPIPNPVLAQKSAEEEETLGEPSNRWSTAFDSLSLITS